MQVGGRTGQVGGRTGKVGGRTGSGRREERFR